MAGLTQATASQPDAATRARLGQAHGRLPLAFEENRGQADPRVRFLSRGIGYTLLLTSSEAVLSLKRPGPTSEPAADAVLRMKIRGATGSARVSGIAELPGRSHYFIGNDPAAWRTDVPTYGSVRYESVYPGVDLVFHGSNQRQLEYDFVVAPGADPARIRLAFEGTEAMRLDEAGDLVLSTAGGEVIEKRPVAYQEIAGSRRTVDVRYERKGRQEVAFRVEAYDRREPLVIDPVLVYSTYLGGSSTDGAGAIALDSAGNVYVGGGTNSADFPASNPLQAHVATPSHPVAFIAKLSPSGDSLVYSTYLDGRSPLGSAGVSGIAVDATGSVYVTGSTDSADFPTVNPVQASLTPGLSNGAGIDAFVAKLSPEGNALVYSTYLGGSCVDAGTAIAVDAAGNAYVTGGTGGIFELIYGANCTGGFPTANAFQSARGGRGDVFLAKLPPSGRPLVYSTYLGGAANEIGTGIALDDSGSVYVVGITTSANFPTVGPVQGCDMNGDDAFVTKFSPAGDAIVYSTCLGGACDDKGFGIAVDGAGSAYVTGSTCSLDFPTVNAFQPERAAFVDGFVAKLTPDGHSLSYSTYLGGNSEDYPFGIAVDDSGSAYVAGMTLSSNFPTRDAVQSAKGLGLDGFVTKLGPRCGALVYSTYLGGSDPLASSGTPNEDAAMAIKVDSAGHAHVAGYTSATNFPTANALQPVKGGTLDAFVAELSVGPAPPVEPVAHVGGSTFGFEGATLALDGSHSFDPDCDPLRYHWEQIAGPTVVLSDPTAPRPTFTAPAVAPGGATLTFRLVVDDGVHTSAPETLNVGILNVNHAPVADAGADQTVQMGSTVTLHAEHSFDPDGDSLYYFWEQTGGGTVALSDPSAVNPGFTAPAAGETLVFTLTVIDVQPDFDYSLASTDDVQVLVTNVDQAPTAAAGSDQTADEGTLVTLQGQASSDPEGRPLTYDWTQLSGPTVVLSDPSSPTPSFTAPAVGGGGTTLVFQLVVRDGANASEPDEVTVTVRDRNQPPSCERAQASAGVLWPPNHRMFPVGIAGVTDPDDSQVTISITSVTQDEPVDGQGDGDTSPDAVLQGSSALVRAERGGLGTGRVYRLTFTASDASGAPCSGHVTVCVPHDRRDPCLDEGQTYDSLHP
jgi:hypothetical protein